MEVHAPGRPVLTLKEALVHLCIVTTGILIALSLEGAREWWHERQLVRETRENLQNEIRGNQESIQIVLKSLDPTKTRFVRAVEVVSDLSASGTPTEAASLFSVQGGLLKGTSFAWLNTASYTTAAATGALGLMEYSEALMYSDIYDLQALYTRMQDGAQRDAWAAYILGTGILTKPSPGEIEDVKRQLRLGLSGILQLQGLATTLNERYSRVPKDVP